VEKERLDIILVNRGYLQSRERAKSAIMAGIVYVNNVKEDKPGTRFPDDCKIEVREKLNPYVSRGGKKLEKSINEFNISLEGKICMDVGASTGGFTDCMLQNNAAKVFAIDVGYGQLAWELRNDERVVCMERTNIRYVKLENLGEIIDFASIDVSFISLRIVLPPVSELLREDGEIICLIKPQFEAGREKVGKRGVVRDAEVHKEVIKTITEYAIKIGFFVKGLTYSPIKGPEGNIEYLLYISKVNGKTDMIILNTEIDDMVRDSHSNFIS
jgi:23S rRNA (cytidine1920-2'-O)/16S rRNA (cytidine1409-2'-O)-methyltransferase